MRAKRFLSGKGITFTEKNILFPKNLKELKSVSDSMSLPVTCVEDQVLIGFSSVQYEEVFKNK